MFMLGNLSTHLGYHVTWRAWREVYGHGWRQRLRHAFAEAFVPFQSEAYTHLSNTEWHLGEEERETCHRFDGQDFHYCTPDYRCFEWQRQEVTNTLPPKAAVGWSQWLRQAHR